ncbi:MAG: hypothetical protein KIT52_13495 [Anaerolineae bacterium]|nr:hypothetical protein [Anaerolineae bacterium]
MSRAMRSLLVVVCAVQLIFAVAFFCQWPWAVRLWPFAGTTPLTYVLLASFFAAAAASTLWPLASGHFGALRGVALDYVFIFGPLTAVILWLGLRGGESGQIVYALLCAGGLAFGLWLWWWAGRWPLDTSVPMPALVRGSFAVLVLALLFVSVRLWLRLPTIPWKLTPELSLVVGCMFFGAAVYFVYGLLRPSWANAGGQLAGFLAYDLVLIVPFLRALPGVASEFRTGLIVYLVVVVYSGLLAIYYLFINRETRLI